MEEHQGASCSGAVSARGGGRTKELQQVGEVVWAKVHRKGTCWPGIIINGSDCGKEVATDKKVWVYWFGDHRITEVQRIFVYDFKDGFGKYFKKKVGKGYDSGVIEAIKECARRLGKTRPCLGREMFISWATSGFPDSSEIFVDPNKKRFPLATKGLVPSRIRQRLQAYRRAVENENNSGDSESGSVSSKSSVEMSDSPKSVLVQGVKNKQIQLSELCLACFSQSEDLEEHPLFNAFLCPDCMTSFKKMFFSVGTDGSNFNCIVCLGTEPSLIYMCSKPHCFRSFCEDCLRDVFPVRVKNVEATDTWDCFMCTPYSEGTHGFVQPLYTYWRRNVWELFHKNPLEVGILTTSSVQILVVGGTVQSVRRILGRLSVVGIEVSILLVCGFSKKHFKELSLLLPAINIKDLPAAWRLDAFSLAAYGRVDIVIGGSLELYSSDPSDKRSMNAVCVFDDFHRIVSNIKAGGSLSPLFWLFEFEEPVCPEFYVIVSRFLSFEAGRWEQSAGKLERKLSSTLVWTNVSLLWDFLEGEGLPKRDT